MSILQAVMTAPLMSGESGPPPFEPIDSGQSLGITWTVEVVADLTFVQAWAVLWGNESYNAGLGHFAYFVSTTTLNVGSPSSQNEYTVPDLGTRAHWVFTHTNGGGVSVYRNGVLLTPSATNYIQSSVATNTLLWGGRHNNDGIGFTDTLPGNYLYTNIRTTALDAAGVISAYNALSGTYGFTPIPTRLTSGTALGFNGTDNRHVIVADNLADWNLGDNWTIEWWHNIPVGIDGFLSVLCQDANVPTYSGIDVYINAGSICMFNGNLQVAEAPATRGEWNHIAIQKNSATGLITAYINGAQQSVSGSHPGTIAPSSPLNVAIGSRTYDGGANFYGQYFNGQLANIRISNTARYSGPFIVPTTVVTDASTMLALDGSVGSGGMLVDESSRHTITNVGATIESTVGSKQTIADDGSGGLIGWGPGALAIAYDANIITTYPVGSTITFQNGDVRTITGYDPYAPNYIDVFWTGTTTSSPLFPITLYQAA